MKRGPALYAANCEEPRFKVLRQRGQLPFVPPDGDGYTLDHAFRLRLLLDLIGNERDDETTIRGLPPSYAVEVVRTVMGQFPRHPLNQIEPADWWAGLIVAEQSTPDGRVVRQWTYAGELAGLSPWVEERRNRGEGVAVRQHLVNVTRAADGVRDRAEEIGFSVPVFLSVGGEWVEGAEN
jgi:hypothetical protein